MLERESRCSRYYSADAGAGYDVKAVLLGKSPQYAPDRTFDTTHIRIELDFDLKKRAAKGACDTHFTALEDKLKKIELDAAGMKILKVTDGRGHALPHKHKDDKLEITLPRTLALGETGLARVEYRIEDPEVGLHFVAENSPNARGAQVWSHGEPEDSRYWFPCHDAPHEKATSEVVAVVPAGYMAVSNGVLVSRSKGPRAGTETFHWRMERPHAPYLICVCVGRFSEIKEQWEDVPVAYYCEKGREADARRGFGKTPAVLDFFSKKLGVRYPYARYAQVAVSEFPGGMEHTTCTTQTDVALIDERAALDTDFDGLVAHELAHQWFGDLLTCKDWSHAWLNEGFATYFESLFTEHDKGADEFRYEMSKYARSYFHEDESRYRRPIVTKEFKYPWVLFDRHLYEKGGAVLHMLRRHLGDEVWWRAIGHYVETHKDGVVETQDLVESIRQSTGKNVQPFFDQWIYRSGYPAFRLQHRWDAKAKTATLWTVQTQRVSEDSPLFKMKIDVVYRGRGWEERFTEEINQREHTFEHKLPGEPRTVEFDPEGWILKKVEFKKPYRMWANQLTEGSVLGRVDAAYAVARWGAEEAVNLLKRAFDRERFWGVQSEIAQALASIRTPASTEALLACLKAKHPKTRRAVVQALSGLADPMVVAKLKTLRKDPSYHIRGEVLRALGRLRDAAHLPALKQGLAERSWFDVVRSAALAGMADIRKPEVVGLLKRHTGADHSRGVRLTAVRALGAFSSYDDSVIPFLGDLLEKPNEWLQQAVAAALGGTDDSRALPFLEKVRDGSKSERVRVYAEEAIARIRRGLEPKGRRKTDRPK